MSNCLTLGCLGKVATTQAQTGITTIVDVTGATVTVTVAAGRRLKLTFTMQVQVQANPTAGDLIQAFIYKDGSSINSFQLETGGTKSGTGFAGDGLHTFGFVGEDTPTAGSHTYKLRVAAVGAATPQIGVNSGTVLLVEDIGT